MTSDWMSQIIDRIANDDAFCDTFLADPQAAAKEAGGSFNDAELETLKSMSQAELRAFVGEYKSATDPNKRRAAC